MVTTADQREIDNFAALSDQWWDPAGPMAPLHAFTPIRIDYILANIERFLPVAARAEASRAQPLTGLRILDIGCGGGLLAEPMARLGGSVTGTDVTEAAITAAALHASQNGLDIDYQCCTAETLASSGARFDVIYASEGDRACGRSGAFYRRPLRACWSRRGWWSSPQSTAAFPPYYWQNLRWNILSVGAGRHT
jgi:2-polyprenyl-6-hydroxyphenyl methylase/3-demethylubiquinone-9 3-methyltransferase